MTGTAQPGTARLGSGGDGIRAMLMRGGTSKGLYLVADDLPTDTTARDDLLLRIMGTPDPRQIDGIGGATPLTSKVAVVSPSAPGVDADVDYLFLQLGVDEALVTDRQNCGNLLAGVGPFALERGLVTLDDGHRDGDRLATVRIRMVNTDSVAVARFPTDGQRPQYHGDTAISGVPGTGAAIRLDFADVAGSSCGALLPTGSPVDEIDGVACTLIDNGMPVVVMAADALGVTGDEPCHRLEADTGLRARLDSIRLQAGPLMNLGDVAATSVPKLTLVSPPGAGGHLRTRTFIPHRCHDAIGVLGAVSVATAALIPGTPAAAVMARPADDGSIVIEHPTGSFTASVDVTIDGDIDDGIDGGGTPVVGRSGIIRTARRLFDGVVFPREYP